MKGTPFTTASRSLTSRESSRETKTGQFGEGSPRRRQAHHSPALAYGGNYESKKGTYWMSTCARTGGMPFQDLQADTLVGRYRFHAEDLLLSISEKNPNNTNIQAPNRHYTVKPARDRIPKQAYRLEIGLERKSGQIDRGWRFLSNPLILLGSGGPLLSSARTHRTPISTAVGATQKR